jgi:hypothetical protein
VGALNESILHAATAAGGGRECLDLGDYLYAPIVAV